MNTCRKTNALLNLSSFKMFPYTDPLLNQHTEITDSVSLPLSLEFEPLWARPWSCLLVHSCVLRPIAISGIMSTH